MCACCSLLQCVALCSSALQCVAVCTQVQCPYNTLQYTSSRHVMTPSIADWLNFFKSRRSSVSHTATHCNTLQHTATHCNALQHTTTHCNTLQLTCNILPCMPNVLNAYDEDKEVYEGVLQLVHCNTLQHTATHHNTLQHACNTPATRLQHACNTLATRLQHACNTPTTHLHHAATHEACVA